MIAFLTLLYVGVLALLVKLKVIKLTLWWKISPLVWMLLLIVFLFIPMQWGAPGGTVNIYQFVVEIVPNVSGEVVEVPVRPLQLLKQGDVLFKIDPKPYQDKIDKLHASLKLAQANLARAKQLYAKRLGPEIDVDRFASETDQLTAELSRAEYDLEQTIVRAPGDGYVIGLSLRPGQRVVNMPLRGWMSFVNLDQNKVVIGINQNTARHVRIGQSAEVTFKILPGKIFNATVERVAPITPQGQLAPSGNVPLAPSAQDAPLPLAVILAMDEETFIQAGLSEMDLANVPGGAFGTGAIYTNSSKVTHIIRKVILRMDAWLNYIIPF
jgi:multidrug resistance efflux pump